MGAQDSQDLLCLPHIVRKKTKIPLLDACKEIWARLEWAANGTSCVLRPLHCSQQSSQHSVHGSVRRNNGSHGQEYQEAGYTAGDRHRPQCWAGGGGTYSASGLRHFTTPQLLCFPSKGGNHGQPFPKAPAALRIKAPTFTSLYARHRMCGQAWEAKGLSEAGSPI